MRYFLISLLALVGSRVAVAQTPAVSIALGSRHGHVTPSRQGFTHTGGGNIDVSQLAPDTVVVTMTGVAVAGGHPAKNSVAALHFVLDQCFDIKFDDPKLKKAKLSLEARVIGLLRTHSKGTAEEGPSCATVSCGSVQLLTVCAPPHTVSCGDNRSVNCTEGPVVAPITVGSYTLNETFVVQASHPRSLLPCKAASSEFAPDPALDPLWISYWEPFHGAAKKDFGFRVTIKVLPD
jgi:hypothetical protein